MKKDKQKSTFRDWAEGIPEIKSIEHTDRFGRKYFTAHETGRSLFTEKGLKAFEGFDKFPTFPDRNLEVWWTDTDEPQKSETYFHDEEKPQKCITRDIKDIEIDLDKVMKEIRAFYNKKRKK